MSITRHQYLECLASFPDPGARFGLIGFYGIVGYLMPNPLYTYILNIYMIFKYFVDNILK